jgi:hypothetical protein
MAPYILLVIFLSNTLIICFYGNATVATHSRFTNGLNLN